MDAGACIDDGEGRSNPSIDSPDRDVTLEEPQFKSHSVRVSKTFSYAIYTLQIVTPCSSFHMSSQVILYVLVCNEGYLCLLQGGLLVIGGICFICLLVFFFGSQAFPSFLLRLHRCTEPFVTGAAFMKGWTLSSPPGGMMPRLEEADMVSLWYSCDEHKAQRDADVSCFLLYSQWSQTKW
jgi:hypothetical protein